MPGQDVFTIKIGGQAGQGVKSAGLLVAKLAVRSGYHTFDYTEYPSLIRGGHNVMQINISGREVTAPFKKTDLLVTLNQETVDRHLNELAPGSGIIFDSDDGLKLPELDSGICRYPVPLSKLAGQSGGKELLSNTVALGAVTSLLGADLETLKNLLVAEYGDKGKETLAANYQAAEAGYNHILQHFGQERRKILTPRENQVQKMVINGNEAVALGAIAAGLQFAAIYPMSPISNILHILAENQEKFGFVYKQPEDEIAAINMAIGASVAGARSMTATSGGGFCLMTEGYGLAGNTETPLVIIEGMRGGPATGLPTWSGQGDLQFVLHSHQGDFPRIVLAAGDPEDAFNLTMQAFNLADKYQTPVVVLIDKNICENDQSFPVFNTSAYKVDRGRFSREQITDYSRFALSEDGISLRSVPGSGNFFIANSDEHDETGYSNEEVENRNLQMHKRMKKLDTCARDDMQAPILYGPVDADITFVSWGSNKGSILQAIKGFDHVNFLYLNWLNPFPAEAVREYLENARYLIDVECNFTGQLAQLIREKTGIDILDRMLKDDGRPFFAEDIADKINKVLRG